MLPDVDRIIYVDTDILFHVDIADLWSHFESFNASQLAGVAPESEDPGTNWYPRFARHPYYQPTAVNSGVMLMRLDRMRRLDWSRLMWPVYDTYRYNLSWGDQDVLNVLFHEHRDWVYLLDCTWNYRPDQCMYSSTCKLAERVGIRIVHGSRSYFHLDKQPAFKAVYDVWRKVTTIAQLLRQKSSTKYIRTLKRISSIQ